MIGHSKTFYASSTRDYAIKQIMREASSAVIVEKEPTPVELKRYISLLRS